MEKGVLRNFTKFTGKHLCQSLFFNKVAGLRPATLLKKRLWHRCFPKKGTLAQVFSCEFCKISKNTFFYGTPLVAASVSRSIDRLSRTNFLTYPKETRKKNQSTLLRNVRSTSKFSFGTDIIDRIFIIYSTGSASCKNTITRSPASSKSGSETRVLISAANSIECLMQTGTALLDSKFKIFNEKVPCENSNGDDHLSRCLRNGLGSSLPGKNNQGNLIKSGTSLAHKSF